MSLISKIKTAIFGYDVFISYSRKDSLDYAYAIAQYFMRKGYECYIDQLSSVTPGEELPNNIKDAVKRSTAFVLIGSEGAQKSKPIEDEITLFLKNNKNKPFIPITIDGAINTEADWFKRIIGLALIDDTKDNVKAGTPAQDVLDRIENALRFTKKSKRLRNTAIAILITALALTSYVFYEAHAASVASGKARMAIDSLSKAMLKLNEAQKDASNALEETKKAKDTLIKTNVQLALVKKDIENTKRQLEEKERGLITLQAQIGKTVQAKDSIEKVALNFKKEADNYQRIAMARNLANLAKVYEQTDPQFAILLATYAYKQFNENEQIDPYVESTLRQVMANRNGTALSGHYEKMRAVTFNHSGSVAATGDGSGVIKFWDITNQNDIHFLCNLDFDNEVGKLRFSTDDRYLIANFSSEFKDSKLPMVVKIWDVSNIPKKPSLVYVDTCSISGISEDGQMWALIDKDQKIRIHRLGQHDLYEPLQTFDVSTLEHIDGLTFSSSKNFLAADTHDSLAYVWQLGKGSDTLYKRIKTRDGGVFNLAFTPDDSDLLVASGSTYHIDTLYSLYSIKEEKPSRKILFNPRSTIKSVFLRDSSILSICQNGEVYAYTKEKDSLVLLGSIPSSNIVGGICSKDGKTILVTTDSGTVYHVNIGNREISVVGSYKSNNESIDEIALSSDSKYALLTAYADKIPLFIKLPSQNIVTGPSTESPFIEFSKDKTKAIAYFEDRILVLKRNDSLGFEQLGEIESPNRLYALVSPDGNWLLDVIDTSHTTIYSLYDHVQRVGDTLIGDFETEFSPNSNYLLLTRDSSTLLYLLDPNGTTLLQKEVANFPLEYDDYSFSPDSKWLYLGAKADSNPAISGKLIYLPSVFTSDSAFLVKGLSGSYKSHAFSPNSDVLFCTDGYKEDSTDYRMYRFRLHDNGEVYLADSLTNKDRINVLQSCDINNKVIVQAGEKLYCANAEEPIDEGDYLFETDNLSFEKIFFSPDGRWLIGFDKDRPIANLWRTDTNPYYDGTSFYKIPLPFKNAASFARYFFSPDSKYLGIYSEVEPSIYIYCLSDSVNYDSTFTLVSFDNNNLIEKVEFSPVGDTLYVLNHDKNKTSNSVTRYYLQTHSEFPITIVPPSKDINDFSLSSNNSTIVTYGRSPKVWQTGIKPVIRQAENFTGRNFTLSEWRRLGNKPLYQPVFDSIPFDESYFYNSFSEDSLWGILDDDGRIFNQMKNLDVYISKSQDFRFCILAGTYFMHKTNLESALKAFARAEYLLPDNGWYLLCTAYVSGCTGNFKKAIDDFNLSLEKEKDTSIKETIEKILRKLEAKEKLKAKDWPFYLDMIY